MPSETFQLAERYALGPVIAKGGMATVYEARDSVLARKVAIKILDPELAGEPGFLERFRREALAAARLTHPHIVATYDTGAEHDEDGRRRHFIVMEYCGGGNLDDRIRAQGRLPPQVVAGIGRNICEALAYAHREGILHGDIKPGNILSTDDGVLKVSDFAIAKATLSDEGAVTTGVAPIGARYLSPELSQGRASDPRSDIYSLGVVLYEALVGRPPFDEDNNIPAALKRVHEDPPAPRHFDPTIPEHLEQVVLKALQKAPEDRFSSADEMLEALSPRTPAAIRPALAERSIARQSLPAESPIRWIVPVATLAAIAVGLSLWVSTTVDRRNAGVAPPNGGRAQDPPSLETVEISRADDFDPNSPGREEHSEEVPLAHDGDPSTAWTTENYRDPLRLLPGKKGVGLVFDLGSATRVAEVRLATPTPGMTFQIRAAADLGPNQTSFEKLATATAGDHQTIVRLPDSPSFRYWLLWIVQLPGGVGSAAVAEVEFLGP